MLEDRYDGSSELVAELVTVNGFKAAFAIKDGAEGPRGWTVITIFLSLHVFIQGHLSVYYRRFSLGSMSCAE